MAADIHSAALAAGADADPGSLVAASIATAPPRTAVERIHLFVKLAFPSHHDPSALVSLVHDPSLGQATLTLFGRRFVYSSALPEAAREGVYRAALCRNVLGGSVLPAATSAEVQDAKRLAELAERFGEMASLAPMPQAESKGPNTDTPTEKTPAPPSIADSASVPATDAPSGRTAATVSATSTKPAPHAPSTTKVCISNIPVTWAWKDFRLFLLARTRVEMRKIYLPAPGLDKRKSKFGFVFVQSQSDQRTLIADVDGVKVSGPAAVPGGKEETFTLKAAPGFDDESDAQLMMASREGTPVPPARSTSSSLLLAERTQGSPALSSHGGSASGELKGKDRPLSKMHVSINGVPAGWTVKDLTAFIRSRVRKINIKHVALPRTPSKPNKKHKFGFVFLYSEQDQKALIKALDGLQVGSGSGPAVAVAGFNEGNCAHTLVVRPAYDHEPERTEQQQQQRNNTSSSYDLTNGWWGSTSPAYTPNSYPKVLQESRSAWGSMSPDHIMDQSAAAASVPPDVAQADASDSRQKSAAASTSDISAAQLAASSAVQNASFQPTDVHSQANPAPQTTVQHSLPQGTRQPSLSQAPAAYYEHPDRAALRRSEREIAGGYTTPETNLTSNRPSLSSQDEADLRAWKELLTALVPDTAFARLSGFLSLHFGMSKAPGVYKPFCHFYYDNEDNAVFVLAGVQHGVRRSKLRPGGTMTEHREECAVKKLEEGYLRSCLKHKQPKHAYQPYVNTAILKYGNLDTLCSASQQYRRDYIDLSTIITTDPGSHRPKPPIKLAGTAAAKASTVSRSTSAAATASSEPAVNGQKRAALPPNPAPKPLQVPGPIVASSATLPDMPKAMRAEASASKVETTATAQRDLGSALSAALPTGPAADRKAESATTSTSAPIDLSLLKVNAASKPAVQKSVGLPMKPAFEPEVPLSPKLADYSMRLRDHYQPGPPVDDRTTTRISASMARSTSDSSAESSKRPGKRRERSPSTAADEHRRKRSRQSESHIVRDERYDKRRDRERERRERSDSVRRSRSPRRSRHDDREHRRSRSRSPDRRDRERDRRGQEDVGRSSRRRRSDDSDGRHRSHRRSSDDSGHASSERRRSSTDTGASGEAMLSLLDLVTQTAAGKIQLDQAFKLASDLQVPPDIMASALTALQAVHEASPTYLMQKSDIPAGTECVMLPKTWVEETLKLLSS